MTERIILPPYIENYLIQNYQRFQCKDPNEFFNKIIKNGLQTAETEDKDLYDIYHKFKSLIQDTTKCEKFQKEYPELWDAANKKFSFSDMEFLNKKDIRKNLDVANTFLKERKKKLEMAVEVLNKL